MRVVVQRVSQGGVYITDPVHTAEIGKGLVILLGIKEGDNADMVQFLVDKCCQLRVFEDDNSKMNLSLQDVDGEALVISQFTLYGDARRGNRPSFSNAARPENAIPLYEEFLKRMKEKLGPDKVKAGVFGAMMSVKIINDGPVTIIIDDKTS